MTPKHLTDATLVALAVLVLPGVLLGPPPAAAQAQEPYNFTASVMGGLGGSTDADPGDGIDNLALQLGFKLVTQPRTLLGFRLGRFDLGSDDRFGSLTDAELTYATVAGEYRLRERFYDSGVWFGLGIYRLDGTALPGGEDGGDDTAPGLTVGVSGDFQITRKLSFLLELGGHYADLDEANVFVTALAGVGYNFR